MPASLRRKSARMCLSADRKLSTTRWIGNTTGRVVISCVSPRGCAFRPKASEGAEKSCLGKRRRKRGLRRSKLRSRGRHPRRSVSPAPVSEEPRFRHLMRHERALDLMEKRAQMFEKQCVQSQWYRSATSYLQRERFRVRPDDMGVQAFRARWQRLSQFALRVVHRAGRDLTICPTFWYFLEKRFKIIRIDGHDRTPWRVLREMLDHRRYLDSLRNEPNRSEVFGTTARFGFSCPRCGSHFVGPTRQARCCGITVISDNRPRRSRVDRSKAHRALPRR